MCEFRLFIYLILSTKFRNKKINRYKIVKKIKKKGDITIKSITIKSTISRKKNGWNNEKNPSKVKQNEREREREFDLFLLWTTWKE